MSLDFEAAELVQQGSVFGDQRGGVPASHCDGHAVPAAVLAPCLATLSSISINRNRHFHHPPQNLGRNRSGGGSLACAGRVIEQAARGPLDEG